MSNGVTTEELVQYLGFVFARKDVWIGYSYGLANSGDCGYWIWNCVTDRHEHYSQKEMLTVFDGNTREIIKFRDSLEKLSMVSSTQVQHALREARKQTFF